MLPARYDDDDDDDLRTRKSFRSGTFKFSWWRAQCNFLQSNISLKKKKQRPVNLGL